MTPRQYEPTDLSRMRTCSLCDRASLVDVKGFAKVPEAGCSFGEWLGSLPDFLGVKELRGLAEAIVAARRAGRPVIWAMGGHVVKVGCGPVVCDLMERGFVTALAMNGATATHDSELALCGRTSEDVGKGLVDGMFGMARETAEVFAEAAVRADRESAGLGGSIGRILNGRNVPHAKISILATAARLGVPAAVHVAMGTDVVHMHPNLPAGLLGAASLWDFRMLCSIVADLGAPPGGSAGGLWVNIGSAVVLPEVFLKCVTVARNLGATLQGMVTANLDMMRQYRTRQNVLNRPVAGAGRSFELIGQHELLLPLLRQAVVEIAGSERG